MGDKTVVRGFPPAPLTPGEREVLALATPDTRKFAVEIGVCSFALEQLQLDNRVRLIDVTTIAALPGLMRVFMVTPAGEHALQGSDH